MTPTREATNASAGVAEPRSATTDDPRVAAALEEFLAELNAGRRPSRADFLARHSEIAELLADSLDGLLIVHSAWPTTLRDDAAQPAGEGVPPAVLGDYRIVRELGRGGMGVVYEAEQISLARRVALKILPLAASLDARQRERFQLEAQAAAHLHHPHIVPVFAVGRDQGVDYYAMQYVEGRTLAHLIKELRQAAAAASSNSDSTTPLGESSHGRRAFFRLAARLGMQAAEALEHAHGLGVLHRDVKPSNLMIDGRGDLWVTDFGLARFQDEEGLTRTGDVIGTLRYMSPEQSRARKGVVDQRADVYSLGATLYELLTLRPPFEGDERQELLREIALDDPTPPRRLNPSLPRDLETILLKALSKDVGTRYQTAGDLADDLHRFLDDRPVEARRPTLLDHAAKWSSRHRAVLLAVLSVMLIGSTVASLLLWREHQQTLRALRDLRAARQGQVTSFQDLFAVCDQITIQAMGTLAASDPTKGSDPGGFYLTALGAYEKVAAQTRNDPEMRLVTSEALRRIGFVQMILRYIHKKPAFLQADAQGSYRQSLALLDRQLADTPRRVDALKQKSAVLEEYAGLILWTEGFDRAAPLYRESLEIARRLATNDPAQRAEWLARQGAWVGMLVQTGRFTDADAGYRTMLEADPENAGTLNNLAWLLCSHPGDPSQDPARAIALATKATERAPGDAACWHTLGMARYRAGRWEDARGAVEQAMQRHTPDAHDWLLLALIEAKRGKLVEARRLYADASKAIASSASKDASLLALQKEAAAELKVER